MDTIYGLLERITYQSEENDFVVAKLQEKEKREPTTIVGNLAGIHPGESLRLIGRWVQNRRFGEQFQVERFEIVVPATVHGIKRYLGSGLIRGIGPVMAERIVERFGLSTLEVIEKTPKRLSEVEGIGPKRVAMIARAWEEQREIKEIMIFLQGHGVSAAFSAKIYRQYGARSIEIVKENPYRLARDIHGVGFVTADRIAQNLGIPSNALIRAKAGLVFVLNQLTEEGHVYYPQTGLIRKAGEMLSVDGEKILQALEQLRSEREIVVEEAAGGKGNAAVYLAPFYVAEVGVATKLRVLRMAPSRIRPIHAEKAIEWIQQKLQLELAERQKEAIRLAATSKILLVTGGPGTGKTTIIRGILKIFQQLKLRVLLAAPTGRAAKRMSEATAWEARTIHRLLEFSPLKGGFKRDDRDPLEAEVVIIDEVSMVDVLLMYHLLKAVPPEAHLILVGDVDQLPSVGPGNVLKDLIGSGSFTVVRLTEIFRQAQESEIVVNAHRVNRGESPVLEDLERKGSDFYFVPQEDPEKIRDEIIRLCREELPRRFRLHPVREIQVLTPMHKGTVGSVNLNMELQKALNSNRESVTYGGKTFRLGDKVMQTVNNYDKDVFNGDIGWISKINPEDRELVIDFDGKSVPYDHSDLDEIVLAYAISVHKSQGSEYPAVVLPMTTQHYLLLQRNLLYTGMTRAKKLLVLIGTKKALAIAIRNNRPQMRFTRLEARLRGTAAEAPV